MSDVNARIAQLFVYPIKSCAGIALPTSNLFDTGLEWDRAWMVVSDDEADRGRFVTQREWPRMALIQPQIRADDLVLKAPGMLTLHLSLDTVEEATTATVWRDTVKAYDMGKVAAQWFSDFLGRPLRLVRFDPEQHRLSNKQWTGDIDAPNQFSDGYPVLVASEASLAELNAKLVAKGHAPVGIERFRPNILLAGVEAQDEDRLTAYRIATPEGVAELVPVKPCARCPIPNIDPATATSSPEVLDTLQTYRINPIVDGGITFGMNAVLKGGDGFTLKVGQAVEGDFRFE